MPKQNIFFRFHTHDNSAAGKNSEYDIIANLYAQPDSYFAHFDDNASGTQYKVGEPNIPLIGSSGFLMILQVKLRTKSGNYESNLISLPIITYGDYRNDIILNGEKTVTIVRVSDTGTGAARKIVIDSLYPMFDYLKYVYKK
ncbi:MAG TPA: hypothetical protein PK431_04645 [Chitinophagales bacterium]|nr:hypothetical protein [Chitinophagales bacterium]